MPPLVQEDARDLPAVPASAAGVVEIHRGAAPERVARRIDVNVVGEGKREPGVAGEPAARLLDDPVEMVEAGSRGVRVARARAGGRRAVRSRAVLQVEIRAAKGGLRDRPARIHDAHVRPREGRPRLRFRGLTLEEPCRARGLGRRA